MGGDMVRDVELLRLENLLMPEQVFSAQNQCSQCQYLRESQSLAANYVDAFSSDERL
jgi:hypothetical protein